MTVRFSSPIVCRYGSMMIPTRMLAMNAPARQEMPSPSISVRRLVITAASLSLSLFAGCWCVVLGRRGRQLARGCLRRGCLFEFEAVAHAWFGDEVSGPSGLGLQLATDLRYVHAQIVGVILGGRPPHLTEELALADQPAGIGHQQLDQVPLGGGEPDLAGLGGHPLGGQVDGEVVGADGRRLLFGWRAAAGGPHAGRARTANDPAGGKRRSRQMSSAQCPQCASPVTTGSDKFCTSCGSALSWDGQPADEGGGTAGGPSFACPACREPNPASRLLCQRCGALLEPAQAPLPASLAPGAPWRWRAPLVLLAIAAVGAVAAAVLGAALRSDGRLSPSAPSVPTTARAAAAPAPVRVDPRTISASASSELPPAHNVTYWIR